MAHIHGSAGENALIKALKTRENLITGMILAFICFSFVFGVLAGMSFSRNQTTAWLATLAFVGCFLLCILGKRHLEKFLDEKLRSARAWQKGYEGERVVAKLLEAELPDGFHVFNDVRFPGRFANIDHLVVGPTGIFVLNTKNWRGSVAWADDGQTLLWNGEPEKKNTVKAALADALDISDKLKTLTNRKYFVKPVLVFPMAKVSPKLDTVVELQQDDYLVEKRLTWRDKRNALSPKEVDEIVAALCALFRESV